MRIIVLTLLLGLSSACTKMPPEGAKESGKSDVKKAEEVAKRGGGRSGKDGGGARVPTVAVQAAAKVEIARPFHSVARLSGRKQADVYPRAAGRLSYLGPKEGEYVRKDSILFKVDRSSASENFLSTPVLSPIDGWIGRWSVSNIGEQLDIQSPVVTVVDDGFLRASVYLSSEDWLAVKTDNKVTLKIGDEERSGKVISISRAADATSNRGTVVVEVDNAKHEWRAGMVANVSISLDPKPRIVIPTTALILTDVGSFVFVAKDNQSLRKPVKYKLLTNDTAEITEGLDGGEQVITLGVNLVSNNGPIKIAGEKAGL